MTESKGPRPSPPGPQAAARLLALLAPIHDPARRTARRLCHCWADGDDLFHEAVLRALARLDQLRDEGKFRPWFFAILLSVHRARFRRHFWQRFLSLDEHQLPAEATQPGPEEVHGRAARMAHALARLPAVQREAVVLFEVDGFSIEEIAAMQGTSESAVKTRLCRGRARLRTHYEALLHKEQQALCDSGPAPAGLGGKESV